MITFSYKISDLTNNAQILSLIRANSMLEKGSENTVDDFSISDEDEALVKKYLKTGAALIAHVLSGYARNLLDTDGVTELEAFEFDVTFDSVEHSFIFRVNMPETWPTSAMVLIDDAIKDGLENYVLYRISKHKMIEGETYYLSFDDAVKSIRSYISRRTTTVIRAKNLF